MPLPDVLRALLMAAAVLGVVVPGIEIADAATVAKTFPDFVDEWTRFVLGAAD